MGIWNLSTLQLEEFRPGIMSKAEIGENLTMVCMEIGPGMEDRGHEHSFDQCGVVLDGQIGMAIGNERYTLNSNESYFIPAGVRHGWKSFTEPVKLLDISAKH